MAKDIKKFLSLIIAEHQDLLYLNKWSFLDNVFFLIFSFLILIL